MAAKPVYSFAPARFGTAGVNDKLCQFRAMAQTHAGINEGLGAAIGDRTFRDLVLKIANPAANSRLDDQVAAWEAFVENLPYVREAGEVIEHPLVTAGRGGDCDDLVVLALGGYYCLGLTEAKPQILSKEDGAAYHVRCLVPVPSVGARQGWRVFDPVWHSEAKWAQPNAKTKDLLGLLPEPTPPAPAAKQSLLVPVAVGVAVGWVLKSLMRNS